MSAQDCDAAKRQELRDLLVELSRWSGVAEKNGDLHARIASALALESSAAEESVGERQGRRPAQDLGQNDAKSVILSSWEKADPLSDPTSGQGANAKPGLSDAPSRDAAWKPDRRFWPFWTWFEVMRWAAQRGGHRG